MDPSIEAYFVAVERAIQTDYLVELKCPICFNILWNPKGCSNCKNYFCTTCIDSWIKSSSASSSNCPKCKKQFLNIMPFPILTSLLSNIEIECIHKINGCNKTTRYDALEKHERLCDFKQINCEWCALSMLQKDYNAHYETCDKVQIQCEACKKLFLRVEKQTHNVEKCFQETCIKLFEKLRTIEDENKELKALVAQFTIINYNIKLTHGLYTLQASGKREWEWLTSDQKFRTPFQVEFELIAPSTSNPTSAKEIAAIGISRKKWTKTGQHDGKGHWWWDPEVYAFAVKTGNKFHRSLYGQKYGRDVSQEKSITMTVKSNGSLAFSTTTENFGDAFENLSGEFYIFLAIEDQTSLTVKKLQQFGFPNELKDHQNTN